MTTPSRRAEPQPLGQGWELPLILFTVAAVGAAAAALAGMALAGALAGHGPVWPRGADLARALGGLLTGYPGRGLPPATAARLPAAATVYGFVDAAEVFWLAVCVAGLIVTLRNRRPSDARAGMATRAEASTVLGRSQLHGARTFIRPDLPARGSFSPADVGWRIGRSSLPRGIDLWCRFDRTTGVYGEQGSGKTLDLLAPALLAHRGAALATLTKVDDLLLTAGRRSLGGRPIAVLDPFGAAPGLPEFIWDPVAGCVDPKVAEKRAKAFAAGTVTGAVSGGRDSGAARFYAAETAKVVQGFLHAAALTGRTLEHILEWVANPVAAEQPLEILRQHPHAAKFWDGLLSGALHGSADTVGNTVTTVQQAMSLFFQPEIRARCVPGPSRPATDIAELIARHGTVYLLGREDPYASATPLMTAVAEHVLDTALWLATTSEHGRLTPSFLACLDELPSTTPLPTLRVRMANERALGLSFIYATQTYRQMVVSYGEDEARSLFGLTNNLVVFGGGKDVLFYKELSDLLDDVRITRQSTTSGQGNYSTSRSTEDVRVLRPGDIRQIPSRHALVIAGNAPPIITRLSRCVEGPDGRTLSAELTLARDAVSAARPNPGNPAVQTADAHALSLSLGLAPENQEAA